MKILLADDDKLTQMILEQTLKKWGYEIVGATNGTEALEILQETDGPRLAILDWLMPGMEGPHVCEKIREKENSDEYYLIIYTIKNSKGDIVAGLWSGADDYVTKPFDPPELRARIQVGERLLGMQKKLKNQIKELEQSALAHAALPPRSGTTL